MRKGLLILLIASTVVFAADQRAFDSWSGYGGGQDSSQYSSLKQINKSNVSKLEIAWTHHLTPEGYNGRPRLAEAIPIVVGNHMYISSPYGEVIALNATTGALEWK